MGRPMNVTAKVSADAQTVLPKQVRERLGVRPGDTVRFRETEGGIVIEKFSGDASEAEWGDPFAVFTEWASPEEDEAWKAL